MTKSLSSGAEVDVRTRIVSAALAALLELGTRRVKSAQLAVAAQTTESTIFRYFRDIEGVFQAVYDYCWLQINEFLYRNSFENPRFGKARDALLTEFDRLWTMRDDSALSDAVTVAFTYYRRPQELGQDYRSQNQDSFERRVESLCQGLIADSSSPALSAKVLSDVLINFAATVWLTWELMDTEEGLTPAEARLGVLGILDRLVDGVPAPA
jgi:AcrR family transcriptional regulator